MGKRSKKHRGKSKPLSLPRPVQSQTEPSSLLFRKFFERWRARIVAAIVFVGSLLALYPLYQMSRDTFPEVHPSGNSSGDASYALPFVIKNPSQHFDMDGIELFCEYNIVQWAAGTTEFPQRAFRVKGSAITPSKETNFKLPAGESINFPCNATDSFKASIEGQALPVSEIQMHIQMNYRTTKSFLSTPQRAYISPVFIWRKAGSSFQWFEGNVVQ